MSPRTAEWRLREQDCYKDNLHLVSCSHHENDRALTPFRTLQSPNQNPPTLHKQSFDLQKINLCGSLKYIRDLTDFTKMTINILDMQAQPYVWTQWFLPFPTFQMNWKIGLPSFSSIMFQSSCHPLSLSFVHFPRFLFPLLPSCFFSNSFHLVHLTPFTKDNKILGSSVRGGG